MGGRELLCGLQLLLSLSVETETRQEGLIVTEQRPKRGVIKRSMREFAVTIGSLRVCDSCRPILAAMSFDLGYAAKQGKRGLDTAVRAEPKLCTNDTAKVALTTMLLIAQIKKGEIGA